MELVAKALSPQTQMLFCEYRPNLTVCEPHRALFAEFHNLVIKPTFTY